MASRWYAKAERYKSLAYEFLQRGMYAECCFFAQQAAEFYIEAKLVELTGSRPYSHSILQLLREVSAVLGVEISGGLARCAKHLTEQYISARYPDARMLDYDREDAEECVKCMEAVMGHA